MNLPIAPSAKVMTRPARFYGEKEEMPLAEALRPRPFIDSGEGQIEEMQRRIEELEEVVGNLAAFLYEKSVLNLDEAFGACQVYGEYEEVK